MSYPYTEDEVKKSSRKKKFTNEEKKMLVELIEPYKHIIENIKVCITNLVNKTRQ